jgi:hypothetical protein
MDKVDNNNIPDSYVRAVMGKPGEPPIPGNTRGRWGQLIALGNGQPRRKQLISTDVYPMPVPWAVQFRFSTDGVTFTPAIPAGFSGGELVIEILKGIDQQSSPSQEEIRLVAGDVVPFCNLIAQSLQISAFVDVEGPASIWVQAIATIVSNVDCADIVGPIAGKTVVVDGYDTSLSTRFAASGIVFPGSVNLLFANPLRRQFFIQNDSDTDFGVLFSNTEAISWTPGSEQLSLIIPAGNNLTYESFVGCYRGRVVGSTKPGGPTPVGFVLVTEGT